VPHLEKNRDQRSAFPPFAYSDPEVHGQKAVARGHVGEGGAGGVVIQAVAEQHVVQGTAVVDQSSLSSSYGRKAFKSNWSLKSYNNWKAKRGARSSKEILHIPPLPVPLSVTSPPSPVLPPVDTDELYTSVHLPTKAPDADRRRRPPVALQITTKLGGEPSSAIELPAGRSDRFFGVGTSQEPPSPSSTFSNYSSSDAITDEQHTAPVVDRLNLSPPKRRPSHAHQQQQQGQGQGTAVERQGDVDPPEGTDRPPSSASNTSSGWSAMLSQSSP